MLTAGIQARMRGVEFAMLRSLALLLALVAGLARGDEPPAATLPWQAFTPALFAQAQSQHKPVFLYLEAVWCHWCHVMQRQTFTDPAVQARLRQQWLIARVDHDADPLLANRYRNYGWPALIFFNAEGEEVVKRAGFLGAEDFSRLLDAVIADPRPEHSETSELPAPPLVSGLPDPIREGLESRHREAYDRERGGLRLMQKYLDRDSVEYGLRRAAAGDRQEAARVRRTLDAARALIDPVWGGIYQYSTHGDWAHPHYEKIMRSQAGALRLYAAAYGLWHRPADGRAAQSIRDYLLDWLRDPASGAFHGSQDADAIPGEKADAYFRLGDAGRRRQGIPRVDPHRYAQENGLAIEALVAHYRSSGDADALCAANVAADWLLAERALPDGRFRHEQSDDGRYLGDSLYAARGLLALYGATREERWREAAERAATAIATRFAADGGGYSTALADGAPVAPPRVVEENIAAARLFADLARLEGRPDRLDAGRHALRWLAQESVAFETLTEPGILIAADELAATEAALNGPARTPDTAADRR